MRTFNRRKLKRLAAAGKLVCVDSYSYDEMSGTSRNTKEMPVVYPRPANWQDRKQGTIYLSDFDFNSGSGRAYYVNEKNDDMVCLIVHSNSNYTFRILT